MIGGNEEQSDRVQAVCDYYGPADFNTVIAQAAADTNAKNIFKWNTAEGPLLVPDRWRARRGQGQGRRGEPDALREQGRARRCSSCTARTTRWSRTPKARNWWRS